MTKSQGQFVTVLVTNIFRQSGTVPAMVTRNRLSGGKKPVPRPLYLMAWRKRQKVRPAALAEALGIERQSYHRLEKKWWTLSAGEINTIATVMDIRPTQLWFPPPKLGQNVVSLDEMIGDLPDYKQEAAIAAVRGIAGR